MTTEELEKLYEKQFKDLIQYHIKAVVNDNRLPEKWKAEHIKKIGRIFEDKDKGGR